MIDEIRDLLRRIDRIVEAEFLRLEDEIDELKSQLRTIDEENDDFMLLKDEAKKVAKQLREITRERDKLSEEVKKIKPLEDRCKELEIKVKDLEQKYEGFKFTVDVVSKWIPSQRDNIDVLVALASSPGHKSSIKLLSEKTTIPTVALKNRIIPMLKEKALIREVDGNVQLTFTSPKDDLLDGDSTDI
ncbi:MAG: hypothetical protein ACTSQE_10435 [Candidatus Heimdallarchaeaceae archaeon]